MARQTVCTSVLVAIVAIVCPGDASGSPAPAADQPGDYETIAALEMLHSAVTSRKNEESEIVTERYPDGRVMVERQVVLNDEEDFVNHGNFVAYARDGHVVGTGQYEMGQRTGEWTRTFARGECKAVAGNDSKGFTPPFTSVASFRNDRLHGDWSIADEKGRTLIHWQFANGERHGQWSWFNADGSVRRQMSFAGGQIASDIVASDGKEKLKVLSRYIDGRELVHKVDHHSERKAKRSEGYVLKPRQYEQTTVDWWNGHIETRVTKTEGTADRHGEWRFWHPNGKFQMQGTYEYGKQVGIFVWWHDNGQLQSQGQYVDGKLDGQWTTSYANGQRHSVGHYVDGKRDGQWLCWHENGMRMSEELFSEGKLVGPSRYWTLDGQRRHKTAQAEAPDDENELR